MNKKVIIAVTGIGAVVGTGVVANVILKKAAKAKKQEEFFIEAIRQYIRSNKCSVQDFETRKYVKEVLMNGKKLSDKQIDKLLKKVSEIK